MMRITLLLAFLLQFSISYSQVTISVANVTASSGSTVDVEFRANTFPDVNGMQFSIRFDPSVITLNQILNTNNALPGFDPTGSFGTDNAASGIILTSWNSSTDIGITLPTNSLLFTIRFNVVGAEGTSSEVYIADTPLIIEFYDTNFEELDYTLNRGSVTVTGGGPGTVNLMASNETAATGSIVCVKISANGFNNIETMQFSLKWNPSFMTFNSIGSNNNSLNITPSNYNVNAANGTFALSYNAISPQSRPNGTVLFEVCFLVNASSGSTSVEFGNDPIEIEIVNGDIIELNTTTQHGSVMVGGGSPDCDPEGFTIAIENVTVMPGDMFCLKIRAFDFNNIAGLGWTFQWNPAELRYLNHEIGFLPAFGAGNIGANMADMGFLGIAYSAPSGDETLADGTTLFEICFEALGPAGTMAMININSEKVEVEILLEDGSTTDLFECKGVVNISNEQPFTVSVASTGIPTCSNSTNGALTATVVGGTGNLTYKWTNASGMQVGGNSPTLTGVGPGTYTVEVTDSSVPPKVAISSPVTLNPLNTINVTPAIVPANCGGNTGSITLNVTGNPGTVAYAWSNGAPNTNTRLNVAAGTYTVTITYGEGCTFTQMYTVPGAPAIAVQGSVNNVTSSVTITVTGGTGPFTYLWNTPAGDTTKDITGVPEGTYSVTVTDANGCTGVGGPFVVGGELSVDIIITDNGGFGVSCNGVCDGKLVAVPVSGTAPFTYKWNNNSTADSLVNVCAGMYTVTVTDANNMSKTAVATVTAPAKLTVSIESFTKSTGTDGAATVEVTGGVPVYTISWNDPAETQGASISGLPPERFIVTAMDMNGCIATRTINFADDSECYEAIPAITPNGDGINDALIISCLEGTTNRIEVYDRYARPVFSASNYANDWEGTDLSGEKLPDGGYFVVIRVTESSGVERVEKRSFSLLNTLR